MSDQPAYMNFCFSLFNGHFGPLIQATAIILFIIIFNYVVKSLLMRLQNKFRREHRIWKLGFVAAAYKPLSYFVWFVALIATLDMAMSGFLHIADTDINDVFSVGAVLAFGWFLLRWKKEIVTHMVEMSNSHKIGWSHSKVDLLSKIGTIVTFVITLVLLMDVTGRNMQTLIAFGGIGGVAIAFASQQFISNFFGGLTIYLTQPFEIGEWINIPERKIEGHVEEIGWYMTKIRDFDKRPIYVPNSIFNQTVVITPSRMTHERLNVKIGLRYQDILALKSVIKNIRNYIVHHPNIDPLMKIEVFFVQFGPTSLEIEISAYVSKSKGITFKEFKQDILLEISSIIAQAGAEMAILTSIVELKSNDS